MKYTIAKKGHYLADSENNRMLFDSKEEAEAFKEKHSLDDCSVLGHMDASKMQEVSGWNAWKIFKDGVDVYTKVWGLDWKLCEAGKWNMNDFTCGHFKFYVENTINPIDNAHNT